jgi:hypothetical protein
MTNFSRFSLAVALSCLNASVQGGEIERGLNHGEVLMVQTYPPPYDFNTQRRDIQGLQDDLAKRLRETPYWDYSAQQKLREQENRLREMDRRNREAETDWLIRGR